MTETEIKLAVGSLEAVREKLAAQGWQPSGPRHYERNVVFDTAEHRLLKTGYLLRLRQVDETFTLTVKEPGDLSAQHKVREEHETTVTDGGEMTRMLKALGFDPAWIYEKHRTRFDKPGENGHIVLDETPIGVFLVLEGEANWIDQTAAKLAYAKTDYITASYRALFVEFLASHPNFGPNMIFT
jgi:adenylate cyclase class 2